MPLSGWLFDVPLSEGSGLDTVAALSPGDIDWRFVAVAAPLMLTILLLFRLYASMCVTGLKAISRERLDIAGEFRLLGVGNLFCTATCCPTPGR